MFKLFGQMYDDARTLLDRVYVSLIVITAFCLIIAVLFGIPATIIQAQDGILCIGAWGFLLLASISTIFMLILIPFLLLQK